MTTMQTNTITRIFAGFITAGLTLAAGLGAATLARRRRSDTTAAHRAAAKAAAGQEHLGLLNTVCPEPRALPERRCAGRGGCGRGSRRGSWRARRRWRCWRPPAPQAPRADRVPRPRATRGTPSP